MSSSSGPDFLPPPNQHPGADHSTPQPPVPGAQPLESLGPGVPPRASEPPRMLLVRVIGWGVLVLIGILVFVMWPRGAPGVAPTTDAPSVPAPAPTSLPPVDIPTGALPSAEPIARPELIAQMAAEHGMDCVDEEREPWLIVGCYRWEPGRILTARFKLTAAAEIEKFQVTLLDDTVPTQEERSAYVLEMARPVLSAMEIPEPDIADLESAVENLTPMHFEPLERALAYVTHDGVAVLGLAPYGLETHPIRAVGPNVDAMLQVLAERGYECLDGLDERFECTHPSDTLFMGTLWQGQLLATSIHFPRAEPDDVADARLADAYAALAAVGPDGPVLNEAIARVVLDRSKHEFVNGLVVQRWESHIAIHSVDFP